MKIYTLIENTSCVDGFAYEHGLSLYIETEKMRILFDSGQSGAFADNAVKLGIDLGKVDVMILSHGHYDHSGGIGRFLELNNTAPVYISSTAFGMHYNAEDRYIGVDEELKNSSRFVFVDDYEEIGEGIALYGADKINAVTPIDSAGLKIKAPSGMIPDTFRHEQYLMIEESNHKVLISGCSHNGILNIMETMKPDVLVGGFHFMKKSVEEVKAPADKLMEYDTKYFTCHCTGLEQFDYMKRIMGDRLSYLSAGNMIEI
jgi:7,8-dihydropterin-6-yl-methyl-4-(beta-D-ribofuranosyl)aminobenzene 5'-phosphate synthase